MHAAFAADAMHSEQIVKRAPSFLDMNVPVQAADWTTARQPAPRHCAQDITLGPKDKE